MNASQFAHRSSAAFHRHPQYEYAYELGVLRGWKTFAIFATDQTTGYFGSRPLHNSVRADQVCRDLGLTGLSSVDAQSLAHALYPRAASLYVGAYPHGVAIAHSDLPWQLFDDDVRSKAGVTATTAQGAVSADSPDFKSRLLSLYPKGQVLAIVLHSVLNLWGYTLYIDGQVVRSAMGSAGTGLFANTGEMLPEEARLLAGRSIERVDADGEGEDLVFAVSARLFGNRIDAVNAMDLMMTEYRPRAVAARRSSIVRKLLGLA